MFKFLVKVVIVVLALQSGVSYLQKQEILVGEIRVNYPVLKAKLMELIPTEQITEKIKDVVNSKINDPFSATNNNRDDVYSDPVIDYQKPRIVVHVVSRGETLSTLSHAYGIPWQVMKKTNDLSNENDLGVGQQSRIPTTNRNFTYSHIEKLKLQEEITLTDYKNLTTYNETTRLRLLSSN